MSDPETSADITTLLLAWGSGDADAFGQLVQQVYDELHVMALRCMRNERDAHTLQPTALVHEAFLRLVDQTRIQWKNRCQFFAIAARTMRRILVDHARSRNYEKRGGRAARVPEAVLDQVAIEKPADLEALDEALKSLERLDPVQAQIVELRFFGGLSKEAIAEVLDLSRSTVTRRYRVARIWLHEELVEG